MNPLRLIGKYWKAILSFLLLPVLGSWFADEARDGLYFALGWRTPVVGRPDVTIPAAGAGLLAAAALAVHAGRELFRPRNAHVGLKGESTPHPHVVLFLSHLTIPDGQHRGGVPPGLDLTGALDADLATLRERKTADDPRQRLRWQWEMPLSGLFPHRTVLRSVTLVCSEQSLPQAPWFAALVADRYRAAFPRLGPGQVRLLLRTADGIDLLSCPSAVGAAALPARAAWNFEAFDELHTGLVAMLAAFAREGKPETGVIFDVTGGQKPNSIVAALVTWNRRAKFQYVRTDMPSEVRVYDLVADPVGGE